MYAQLCSWDNLLLAYRRASKGKRGQPTVAAFEHRLEDNLLHLQEALRNHTYQPGAYTHFIIHEPKRRLISAAPFHDRVVHHALYNIIEPIFERTFVAESYANRVGKGTHRALQHVQELTRRFPYVLQCDLRQYFPSIDHAILRGLLARKIADTDVLWLIDRILDSGCGVLSEVYDGSDHICVRRYPMEPISLATAVVAFLSPYLVKAGEKTAETLGEKLPEAVGTLWRAITTRFKGDAAAETAVKDVLEAPQDADNQATLRKELRKVCQADTAFAEALERLLTNAKRQSGDTINNTGSGAVATHGGVAAGEGGVAVQGSVHGNIATGRTEQKA
jgi:hypothetical protein